MADPMLISLLVQMNTNLLHLNTSVLNLHAKVDALNGSVSSLKIDFVEFRAEVRLCAEQVNKGACNGYCHCAQPT